MFVVIEACFQYLEILLLVDDKMGKILATYDQNMGAVNRLNEERLKTDAGVIDQFESSLENLTVTAGAALGRIFTPVLNMGNFHHQRNKFYL